MPTFACFRQLLPALAHFCLCLAIFICFCLFLAAETTKVHDKGKNNMHKAAKSDQNGQNVAKSGQNGVHFEVPKIQLEAVKNHAYK